MNKVQKQAINASLANVIIMAFLVLFVAGIDVFMLVLTILNAIEPLATGIMVVFIITIFVGVVTDGLISSIKNHIALKREYNNKD